MLKEDMYVYSLSDGVLFFYKTAAAVKYRFSRKSTASTHTS